MARDKETVGAVIVPGKRISSVAPGETYEMDLHRSGSVGIQTGATITGSSYSISVDGNTFIAGSALSANAIVKVDVAHLKAMRIVVGASASPISVLKSTIG